MTTPFATLLLQGYAGFFTLSAIMLCVLHSPPLKQTVLGGCGPYRVSDQARGFGKYSAKAPYLPATVMAPVGVNLGYHDLHTLLS